MYHLNLEALARLVDEAPGEDEAAHLRDCLVCRRELEALREQTFALAELPPLQPSDAAWAALEAQLLEEGLMRTPAPAPVAVSRPAVRPGWLRLAASLALFLAGGGAGAIMWARMQAVTVTPVAQLPPSQVDRPVNVQVVDPLGDRALVERPVTDGSGARLISDAAPAPRPAATRRPPRPAASPAVQAAERELADAEAAYLAALQRYAELADPSSGADPATRLEALDRLVEMSARALDRSPDDAQLNGYHLAAVSERDALRRQIQRAAETTWF